MSDDQVFRILLPTMTIGLAGTSVFAWRAATRDRAHERRAVRSQGVVTKVEYGSEYQSFPTVRFRTRAGQVVDARPASSVNAPIFAVGQVVGLRYDPREPGWMLLDGIPSAGCVGVAVALLLSIGGLALAVVTAAVLAG